MMSPGFFDEFRNYLDQFRDECRRKEFVNILHALVEWRSTQIIVGMLKEGLTDFGQFTPRALELPFATPLNRESQKSERWDIRQWECDYLKSYEKLYFMYKAIAGTFPEKDRGIFLMHDEPPTSLFEYLYNHFFPTEPNDISEKSKDTRLIRW